MTAVTCLHRVRFGWPNGTSLDIEWASGDEGPAHPLSALSHSITGWIERLPDQLSIAGIPALSVDQGQPSSLFEPVRLREQTDYTLDFRIRASLPEATTAWQVNPSWPLPARFNGVYRTQAPRRWMVDGEFLRVGGALNFGSFVGVAHLELPDGACVPVEVICTKIGYVDDFRALLEQVGHEVVELLLTVGTPTGIPLATSGELSASPLAFLFHLRSLLASRELPDAIESILRRPHARIVEDRKEAFVWEFRHPDVAAMSRAAEYLPDVSFSASRPVCLPVPLRYHGRSRSVSRDTQENRYVKALLQDIVRRADICVGQLREAGNLTAMRELVSHVDRMREWLSRPLWREVGPFRQMPTNSQVLQRRSDYRRVFDADMRLHLGLKLPWLPTTNDADSILGDMRPIDVLYEYWCFLVIRRLVASICGATIEPLDSLLVRSMNGLSLQLVRGKQSKTVCRLAIAGKAPCQVELYFNRHFAGVAGAVEGRSYSVGLRPDISLCVERIQAGTIGARHWLHFDAKYRREIDVAALVSATQESSGGPESCIKIEETYKRADLYKMHAYRDAILSTRGAYALFPSLGGGEALFVRGASIAGAKLPSVGMFPLSPARAVDQEQPLRRFLSAVLSQISDASRVVDEYLGPCPPMTST